MHSAQNIATDKDDSAPSPAALPIRKDAPDLPDCDPPQRDIAQTRGGKIIDFIIYKVLGFGGNSALSVGVTYGINPKESVKNFREKATQGAKNLFKGFIPPGAVSNAMEIGFMLISGTLLTACMAPLVNRREKIAYWINQKLGKDTDVLPEHMRTYNTPLTLDDRVEQELKKRVTYSQTSRDLWKARWTAILVPLIGDTYLGKLSASREAENKWSVDTASWKVGQHLYNDVLHKETVNKLGGFFSRHGAGIDDMRKNNPGTYDRLLKVEMEHEKINQALGKSTGASLETRNDRMMIADQTRLLGKEVGWTFVLSEIVERLTCKYQLRRIHKQEIKAINKMREEGIIPSGLKVTAVQGKVTITPTKHYEAPTQPEPAASQPEESSTAKWADNKVRRTVSDALAAAKEKSDSHVASVDKARMNEGQPSLAGI